MINKSSKKVILMVANTSWYLYNFRLPLIHEFQNLGFEVVALSPKDGFSKKIVNEEFKWYDLPLNRSGFGLFTNISTVFRMIKMYRFLQPHYAIHFTIKPVIYGTFVARCFTSAKSVNNITGLGFVFIGRSHMHTLIRLAVKGLYRIVLSSSFRIIFQNSSDREYFINNRIIHPGKVSSLVIPGSGVDTSFFCPAPRAFSDKKNLRFILVARVLKDKGIVEYVEASKIIKKRFPYIQFDLLGQIDEENPSGISEKLVTQWHSENIINYLGAVDDVRPSLQNADVFVLPSYREGLSKSIIEAMAMELPIITTDVPGCRETVVPNENGLIITPRDITPLVNAIKFMVDHKTMLPQMGKVSREIAINKFEVNRINNLFLKALDLV